jgi:hypothetical protein
LGVGKRVWQEVKECGRPAHRIWIDVGETPTLLESDGRPDGLAERARPRALRHAPRGPIPNIEHPRA